jgi:hypothetical protein
LEHVFALAKHCGNVVSAAKDRKQFDSFQEYGDSFYPLPTPCSAVSTFFRQRVIPRQKIRKRFHCHSPVHGVGRPKKLWSMSNGSAVFSFILKYNHCNIILLAANKMNKHSFSSAIVTILAFIIISSFASSALFNAKEASAADTEFQLQITGEVEHPLNFTMSDLAAMPQTTVEATIYCVDFPTQIVETGSWTGVKLSTLLEQVEVSPSAIKVAFYASDGYSTDLDLETATSGDVILAYAKNGVPFAENLRLVVPGKWGYKWISQLTSIVLVDYNFLGRWESQGYSDEADMQLGTGQPRFPTGPDVTTPSQPSAPATPTTPSPSPQPSDTSTVKPSQTSEPEPGTQTSESFPTAWVAISIAVIVASLSLLAYIKKRLL